jgi:hypothetical protein
VVHDTDTSREGHESRVLVEHAFGLARALDIRKVMVHADAPQDIRAIRRLSGDTTPIWMVRRDLRDHPALFRGDAVVHIPDARLTRMSQIHMGVLLAVMNDDIAPDETVLCLAGVAGSDRLDTLVIANPRRDYPWFRPGRLLGRARRSGLPARVLVRVLDIALRLASEGREGKAIGTLFALGDSRALAPYARQLILNPCRGHARHQRSIYCAELLETLREWSAMDGGFVIGHDGVVEQAGAYFDTPQFDLDLEPGLGARHAAAAGLTTCTDAVAVVISESSGTVTVFDQGRSVLQLEQPTFNGPGGTPDNRFTSATANGSLNTARG